MPPTSRPVAFSRKVWLGSPPAPSMKAINWGARYVLEYEAALQRVSTRINPVLVSVSPEGYFYEFEVEASVGQDLASIVAVIKTVIGTSTVRVVQLQRGGLK